MCEIGGAVTGDGERMEEERKGIGIHPQQDPSNFPAVVASKPSCYHISDEAVCIACQYFYNNNNKSSKYCDLAGTHLFFPAAIETAGTWNQMAVELVQEIGRRITLVTEDSRETVFLFQRLSIALQRGNAVSFLSTFTATD